LNIFIESETINKLTAFYCAENFILIKEDDVVDVEEE